MKEQQVRFELEGQHAQWPNDWSLLHSGGANEAEVRRGERQFRDWNEIRPVKGWKDFRVVRVTTTREVLTTNLEKTTLTTDLLADVDQSFADWILTYAPELCDKRDVQDARKRIAAGGGTLAYITRLRERVHEARQP